MHGIVIYDMGSLSIICLDLADNVRELISWPAELVISFCHHLEQWALKSLVTFEHKGNSWFILLRSKSNFVQKLSNSSWLWLGER